eukprot:Rmarinus@m.15519
MLAPLVLLLRHLLLLQLVLLLLRRRLLLLLLLVQVISVALQLLLRPPRRQTHPRPTIGIRFSVWVTRPLALLCTCLKKRTVHVRLAAPQLAIVTGQGVLLR